MAKDNELQNNEMYLPGDLGTVNGAPIKSMLKGKDFVTLTIGPQKPEITDRRDCYFNIDKIDARLKELGTLEDIEHEVVHPKMINNG